jgi:molecular chaperone DnaK
MSIDFGIDLGTTNSSIAVCRRGEVRIFQSSDLMNVVPSVVYISKGGRMLVGKKAYDTWVQDPLNTQAEFKRWMGYSDKLRFPASGRELAAEELSAEVLKALRADAQRQTGEQIAAAVITVPAAFGSLQCDATARAARLAGFEESPLLQEPIAAAIAYGAAPGSQDQRWMVFDLGGGTLDIAIVSTRNDRLAVLEHQGNNRLGGKDIDQVLAERFLLPPLAKSFRLPDAASAPQPYQRLLRRLVRYAEQAKIVLSSASATEIEMFDLGQDQEGNAMELAVTLTRAEMEGAIAPLVAQCLALATRALEGARLAPGELDRVLLVGGPTQMPAIRTALTEALGVKLDFSLDPMTVVAHGAAVYASTLEKTSAGRSGGAEESSAPSVGDDGPKPAAGAVRVELAYERASGSLLSPVAGMLDAGTPVHEVKIDGAVGHWTSGWLPVAEGSFHTEVMLQEGKPATVFRLSGRDMRGNEVTLAPAEFVIARMMTVSAPPLPHTLAIELSVSHGISRFDPVFQRHSPLPAEARKTYKADRALRPSDLDAVLPIKFWEIDVSEDPQDKWWAGCINLSSRVIKRPIPEGTEIELTIKIDTSRRMSVSLFIPLLNQSFQEDVYIPDPPTARSQLQQQIDLCFERLQHIQEEMYAGDREELAEEYEELELQLETIAEQFGADASAYEGDPDAALRPTAALRSLRIQLSRLEEQLNITSAKPTMERQMRWLLPFYENSIEAYGTKTEREEFDRLKVQYHRYVDIADVRGQTWVRDQLRTLHYKVVVDQTPYWSHQLENLKSPRQVFTNQEEAGKMLAKGIEAQEKNDLPGLREACQKLFGLQKEDELQLGRNREAQSGLRSI